MAAPSPGPVPEERLAHRFEALQIARRGSETDDAQPLPDDLRGRMERAFRRDFSRVRLRIGDEPRRIAARALTRGEEISVARNHFRPATVEGQRLLAHELAHVVQQRSGTGPGFGTGGGVFDHSGFEAEADRHGAQALRGEPVRYAGPQAAPVTTAPTGAAPAQPGWETVNDGGQVKKLNLSNLGNGQWFHRPTGRTFTGTSGQALTLHVPQVQNVQQNVPQVQTPQVQIPQVQNIPSPVQNAPQPQVGKVLSHDPKNVLFAMNQHGKIEYLGNTPQNRLAHAGKYLEMSPQDFALFKGAGKRTGSHKVLDPVSLQKYSYDETGKQLYEWDRAKGKGRGKAVDNTPGLNASPSLNEQLLDRLSKGELVDRRRKDRTGEDLSPFDIGPYKSGVTLKSESNPKVTTTWPKLSGIDAWTPKGGDVNRDHVPSGESLNQRGDSGAYNQGFTIAIPNPEFHLPFSPTFGTDNSPSKGIQDTYKKKLKRRVKFDKKYPGAGSFRDTKLMLDKTEGGDFSSGHSFLNLTDESNRLRQIGAYRKLSRLNVKINKQYGSGRGFNPSDSGIDFTEGSRPTPKKKPKKPTKRLVGQVDYFDVPGKSQGDLYSELYQERLLKTKKARLI